MKRFTGAMQFVVGECNVMMTFTKRVPRAHVDISVCAEYNSNKFRLYATKIRRSSVACGAGAVDYNNTVHLLFVRLIVVVVAPNPVPPLEVDLVSSR